MMIMLEIFKYILINVTLRGTGMAPVLRKHASISSSEFWEMSQSLLEMNSTGWPRIRDKDDLAVQRKCSETVINGKKYEARVGRDLWASH